MTLPEIIWCWLWVQMIERMNGSEKVCYSGWMDSSEDANHFKALAEHYAISKTPLARGLKVINTEKATVPMRYVHREGRKSTRATGLTKVQRETLR